MEWTYTLIILHCKVYKDNGTQKTLTIYIYIYKFKKRHALFLPFLFLFIHYYYYITRNHSIFYNTVYIPLLVHIYVSYDID